LEALQLLKEVLWINHPRINGQMENKVRQLLMAQEIGFRIPDTLISSDPDPIMKLHKKYDNKLIAKALYSPLIEEAEQDYFILSNVIESWPAQCDPELRISPAIYQEPLFPKVDYRVTVVGDTVLAAKIYSSSKEFFADWRTQKDGLTFEKAVLPGDIERMCRQYVRESGLVFGAIDLVEFNGRYYFLEINPNGEWGWLQKPHGLPIAEVLCSYMTESDMLSRG
jgi:glutathione synthase/RimK-type ligase-like ATP-grasp enzyme